MYYSAFGLLAIVILLIENQDILFRPNESFDKPAWQVYRWFLIAVFAYYLTDTLWGVAEYGKNAQLVFLDTSVYFVAMAVSVALLTRYIVTYLDQKGTFERVLLNAGLVIAACTAILAIVNSFFPLLFVVDSAGLYHPLVMRNVVLAAQVVLLFAISVYAFVQYGSATDKRRQYRTLGLFGLTMGACLILQLGFPHLPMYAIGYMLGTSLLRAVIIVDEKEEYRLRLDEAKKVAELKQSISSLLDNMPAMSFSKGVESGIYLACNQAFADFVHKATPEDVVGHTDIELFGHDVAVRFVRDDQTALAMDRPFIFYEDVVDAEGNPRHLQTTKLKFYDSNGRKCLLGMSMDLTEAEQAKAAYRRALNENTIHESIVEALSRDYFNLFYVDLETDDFFEYGMRTEAGHQLTESHGTDFFAASIQNAQTLVYEEDREWVARALDKQALLNDVDRNGISILQYRLLIDGVPTYVSLKATRAQGDDRHLIIGINNIDAQMKDRAAAQSAMEDQKTYLRLSALNGNLIALYYVDLVNDHYVEFRATKSYDELGIAKQGDEFFKTAHKNSLRAVHPEDQELFHTMVTKENICNAIERDGVYVLDYRLVIEGSPLYVRLKAAKYVEDGRPMLIIGVLDEDAQVRREQEFAQSLSVAKRMATVDALTGVKNKRAYAQWGERIDAGINRGDQEPFAIAVCDINNLKEVNDVYGHKEGDTCIKRACKRICDVFSHSPVFRVGGDEFVVLLMGKDYDRRQQLMEIINELPRDLSSVRPGDTISAGMVEFDAAEHLSLLSMFETADMAMYQRKQYVKELLAGTAQADASA